MPNDKKRMEDDRPGNRALTEYIILFFVAIALILFLATLLVHLLQGFYGQVLGNEIENNVQQ